MALSKLYYVYGLDTACLYTDEEYGIEQRIIKARCLKEKLKNKLIPHNNKPPEYTLNHNKRMQILTQYINNNKEKLKELLSTNKEVTRTIRPEKLTIKHKVSIFDSNLTRCFGMKERELNEEIIIIRVYFFDVAESIIKQGFYMNGNKYVFFSSSAGQIRTKKLVAVREDLLKKHWNTLSAGLSIERINELGGINRNKYLAYLSLCNSATDVWEGFDIDRSIVVDDFETEVFGTVDYIDNKTFEITRRDMKIPITHTDGCGMICTGNKDFMVRLPWVKGLLGYFPFQDFIKEHNCSPIVTDVWGDKHNIIEENIQVVFTKSQFKLWKYYSNWNSYKENFKKYNCTAGICNEEEDEIPDATINYQMIQTLFDLSDEELLDLAQDSINDIKNLTSDKDTMLRVFGAVPYNKRKNGFQKCLEIYPELLSDIYTRHTLKDIKNSLENDLWSAKLKVNGKYTFLMPDLYAFCEHLFMGIEVPEGLLKNGEVFCRLYPEGKLDCLRSPHLYIEHAVRQNILDEKKRRWFKTKALYTSSFDVISKILQFDVDGDKSLVVANETIINAAERIIKKYNIVPLYYEMSKAPASIINNEELFQGLILAYTGGNIGMISNAITKIWNSGEITEEKIKTVKLLCLQNNFVIDYAKTLYKPDPPDSVNTLFQKYTSDKVPNFFIYAKKKTENQVELQNNSCVNRLRTLVPKQRLNFKFKDDIVGKFDYTMLLKNQEVELNNDIINKFKQLTKQLKFKFNVNDNFENYNAVYDEVKTEMLQLEYDIDELCDVLVLYLFNEHKSPDKMSFWSVFGNTVYEHLKENISKNLIQCKKCNVRFHRTRVDQFYCPKCRGYQKIGVKKLICCDCGEEFEVEGIVKNKKRCNDCQKEYNRINNLKRVKKCIAKKN